MVPISGGRKGWDMNLSRKAVSALAGLMLAGGVSAASAHVIDFTDSGTGTSGAVLGGSVTWTMTANGMLNNSQLFDGNAVPTGTPLAFQTDGYGVGLKDDEITTTSRSQEVITLTFSAPTLIDAIYFLDLFVAKDGSSKEIGVATFDGLTSVQLVAQDIARSGAGGFVAATFAPILATVIKFTVLSSNDSLGFADGALAGVGIAPVPVPAAGLMLLGGLGGLAALRRRKKT